MAQLDFIATITNTLTGESRDVMFRRNVCFANLDETSLRNGHAKITNAEFLSAVTYRIQGDLQLAEKIARELGLVFTTVHFPKDPENEQDTWEESGIRVEVADMARVKVMYSLFMLRNMDVRWGDGVSALWKDVYKRGVITVREFCALSNCFEPHYHAFNGLNSVAVHSSYNSLLPSGCARISDFKRMCIDLKDMRAKRDTRTFREVKGAGYENRVQGVDAPGCYITGSFCSEKAAGRNDTKIQPLVMERLGRGEFTSDKFAEIINSLLGRSVFTGVMLNNAAKQHMKGGN